MRIVGGRLRGRKLQYHGDPQTRPMKERVREAIFNLLGPAAKRQNTRLICSQVRERSGWKRLAEERLAGRLSSVISPPPDWSSVTLSTSGVAKSARWSLRIPFSGLRKTSRNYRVSRGLYFVPHRTIYFAIEKRTWCI